MPLLLGSYEAELHPTIDLCLRRKYKRFVVVGCAEGYYAIGFALRVPDAQVFAYDTHRRARVLCRKAAEANGVAARVHVRAECTTGELDSLAGSDTLIFLDCEGTEIDLLYPARAPNFETCDFIVELHDFVNPNTTRKILERFEATHRAALVDVEPRVPDEYPALKGLPLVVQKHALDERRPTDPHPMQWVVLRSKRG